MQHNFLAFVDRFVIKLGQSDEPGEKFTGRNDGGDRMVRISHLFHRWLNSRMQLLNSVNWKTKAIRLERIKQSAWPYIWTFPEPSAASWSPQFRPTNSCPCLAVPRSISPRMEWVQYRFSIKKSRQITQLKPIFFPQNRGPYTHRVAYRFFSASWGYSNNEIDCNKIQQKCFSVFSVIPFEVKLRKCVKLTAVKSYERHNSSPCGYSLRNNIT